MRKRASKLLEKSILVLETRAKGAGINEARAIAKTISMEELFLLEKHMSIGPSRSGVCDLDSDVSGPMMKSSRRCRRIARVLWSHEVIGGTTS